MPPKPHDASVRTISSYRYDDLVAYVSGAAFLTMLAIFVLILSL